MENPFNISIGRVPNLFIERYDVSSQIISEFEKENPVQQIYILTGSRGSGKTVVLSSLYSYFENKKDWIVIDLNSEEDILHSLIGELTLKLKNIELQISGNIGVNVNPVSAGVSISKETLDVSDSTTLEKLLKKLSKKGKRLLITIDEVKNNQYTRVFTQTFKNMYRKEYPIFLLMTGLYENVHNIEKEQSLTFLFRAPKINIGPLDLRLVALTYSKIFSISIEESAALAKFTKGYALAFQILGKLLFDYKTTSLNDDIIQRFDTEIINYAYQIIFSELTEKQKEIVTMLSKIETNNIDEILKKINLSASQFSPHRRDLIERNILISKRRGEIEFALPRFKEFVYFYYVLFQ